MAKGNIKNLKPVRTKDEAMERGKNGGIKSGKVRREKKIISKQIAEYFGEKDLSDVFEKILARYDSASVALIKSAVDATEGQKIDLGEAFKNIKINIVGVTPED